MTDKDKIEFLKKTIEQAQTAFASNFHIPGCGFKGCTCGTAEKFKTQYSEFTRMLNKVKSL